MNELTTRTAVALQNTTYELGRRLREERGQTAAEYMGIIVLVAAIIAGLFATGVHKDIGKHIETLVDNIFKQK